MEIDVVKERRKGIGGKRDKRQRQRYQEINRGRHRW